MTNNFEKIKEASPAVKEEKGPLGKFREMLDGWMTCESGDYCPDCWGKRLEEFRKKPAEELIHKGGGVFTTPEENKAVFLEYLQKDAKPTAQKDIAKSRKILDGYHTSCVKCGKVVFAPKKEETK